jgi:tetratricopeptide (TPR) repeat protein
VAFSHELSEKLTILLGATVLCCLGGTLPPGIVEHATVEALLGAAGLTTFLARMRRSRIETLLHRCIKETEPGIDALLAAEYRDAGDPAARRDAAIQTVIAVMPLIVPQPNDYATARLTRDRVVAFYLARAAQQQPSLFGDRAEDTVPLHVLEAVIGNAWRRVMERPEFQARLLQSTLQELLAGQDTLRQEVREGNQDILDRVVTSGDDVVRRIVAELDARGVGAKAAEAGLERHAMLRIARRLKPDELLDFDQAMVEVEHAVEIALDVIARGERRGNLEAFVEDILTRLAAMTRAGEFDRGSRAVDDALRDLDQREAEHQAAMRRSRVALLEAGIEQDTLRRDAAGVAQRIEALVAMKHPGERPAGKPAFLQRWNALHEEGRDKGINFLLEVAAELARRQVYKARNRYERGTARNRLGMALRTLGERESGTARLEQAVTAYRAALQEHTRERVPLNWAATQNNLGNALWRLGERESGTARLEQAVVAFRAALQVHTRERAPLDWAMTQNNLGNALARLGERERGTARLEQAVDAYRASLQEHTRERVPLNWAMTQNNLGNALATLGERENSTARFEQAVTAYRAALQEHTRQRVPLSWAAAQNNLGNALQALGARESGTAWLEQAVAAYRAALQEHTRERVPLDWAKTQSNLGNALQALGERESGTTRLEQAVEAYDAALEERTRERVPLDWAQTQTNLGNALTRLGERESGTQASAGAGRLRLEEAVDAYRAALAERTRESVPLDWAATQNNLGIVLRTLGERESGTERLEQANEACRAALLERTRERVPLDWAHSQHGLAETLALLAARAHDPGQMAAALEAMRGAAEVYRQAGDSHWLPIAEQRVGEIEGQLAAMRP